MAKALRVCYAAALLNGPFSIIVGFSEGMVGLNDRIKLRPLVAGRKGDRLYLASEEAAIRQVSPVLDSVWAPKGGEVVVGRIQREQSCLVDRKDGTIRYDAPSAVSAA